MKLYAVKPEWLYGDDADQKREKQLEMLKEVGVEEAENLGAVVCNAEQAIELVRLGYCGVYTTLKDHIKPIYEVKSEINVNELIASTVSASMKAVDGLFNSRCDQEQPGNALMSVTETMVKENCCTDELQNSLKDGWRIIAVCPQQTQRRPDYILGRSYIPSSASR